VTLEGNFGYRIGGIAKVSKSNNSENIAHAFYIFMNKQEVSPYVSCHSVWIKTLQVPGHCRLRPVNMW